VWEWGLAVLSWWLRLRDYLFFFFSSRRRHTRSYGDWSSDVCSSDLTAKRTHPGIPAQSRQHRLGRHRAASRTRGNPWHLFVALRSEERRVGKECRSRGSTDA